MSFVSVQFSFAGGVIGGKQHLENRDSHGRLRQKLKTREQRQRGRGKSKREDAGTAKAKDW